MARIPTYSAERGLDVGGAINLPSLDQSLSSAVEGLGRSIGSINIDLHGKASGSTRQRKEQDPAAGADKAWFSKARAQTAAEWARRDRDPSNDPTRSDSEFDKYRQGVIKGAPSAGARALYEHWAGGFRDALSNRAARAREEAAIAGRSADLTAALSGHAELVTADPDQYEAALFRTLDDLEGAREWMPEEDEARLRVSAVTGLQRARAEALIDLAPELLEAETSAGDDRYSMLDEAEIRDLRNRASGVIADRMAAEDDLANIGDPALEGEAFELLASNRLTPEWYAANADSLPYRARRVAERALEPSNVRTSPRDELNLVDLAWRDGEGAVMAAADAFAEGSIDRDAFARVHKTVSRAASLPPQAKMARGMVANTNRPGRNAPQADYQRHLQAVQAFDDFLERNPNATPKEMQAFADALTENERRQIVSETRDRLELPRHVPARSVMTPDSIVSARNLILADFEAGSLDERQAGEQALRLMRWVETAEPEERKLILAQFAQGSGGGSFRERIMAGGRPSKNVEDRREAPEDSKRRLLKTIFEHPSDRTLEVFDQSFGPGEAARYFGAVRSMQEMVADLEAGGELGDAPIEDMVEALVELRGAGLADEALADDLLTRLERATGETWRAQFVQKPVERRTEQSLDSLMREHSRVPTLPDGSHLSGSGWDAYQSNMNRRLNGGAIAKEESTDPIVLSGDPKKAIERHVERLRGVADEMGQELDRLEAERGSQEPYGMDDIISDVFEAYDRGIIDEPTVQKLMKRYDRVMRRKYPPYPAAPSDEPMV